MASDSPSPKGFRSLTTRLIVWTLLAVGAVYVATVVVSNQLARREAIAAAEREAINETEGATSRVEDVLHSIEERTLALGEALSVLAPRGNEANRLLRRFVEGNRDFYGGAIAWVPGPRGEKRALYYHWPAEGEGGLEAADLASDAYRFWERDWFQEATRSGRPLWTEPYLDRGGGEAWMVTFAVPFGAGAAPAGVVTADVRLARLDSIVKDIELGRNGFGLLLSRSGFVIATSERGRLDSDAPLLEQARPEARARLEPIVRSMRAGEPGFARVELGGIASGSRTARSAGPAGPSPRSTRRTSCSPRSPGCGRCKGRWLSAASPCSPSAVVLLSRRLTRPLIGLAASADAIARGDLDAPLPAVESRDEVGALALAFLRMRDSLKDYIRDLRETTAAKERLEGEIKVARRIQADMLPKPEAGGRGEGYELGATLVPARAVGGDLYDHFRDGARVFVLAGDVSGKGVAAALFMARTKTVFEAVASREGDPGAVLDRVNRSLCRDNEAGMFVTAAVGVLDLGTGDLDFALAGHEPPLLVPADGPPEPVRAEGGRVLGLIEESAFPVNRLRLRRGDAVVLYTDGVSEAQDARGRSSASRGSSPPRPGLSTRRPPC